MGCAFLECHKKQGGTAMKNRLRDLREDHDFNQTQVANILNMSQTGYSKYETGENDIPTLILVKLADYYKVSIDYLLFQTDIKQRYPASRL